MAVRKKKLFYADGVQRRDEGHSGSTGCFFGAKIGLRLRFAVARKEVVARTNTIQRDHDIPIHTSWIHAPVHRLLHRCIEEKRSIRLQQANSDESSFLACAPVLLSREPARGNKDKRFHVSSLLRKLINRYAFPIIIRRSFFYFIYVYILYHLISLYPSISLLFYIYP